MPKPTPEDIADAFRVLRPPRIRAYIEEHDLVAEDVNAYTAAASLHGFGRPQAVLDAVIEFCEFIGALFLLELGADPFHIHPDPRYRTTAVHDLIRSISSPVPVHFFLLIETDVFTNPKFRNIKDAEGLTCEGVMASSFSVCVTGHAEALRLANGLRELEQTAYEAYAQKRYIDCAQAWLAVAEYFVAIPWPSSRPPGVVYYSRLKSDSARWMGRYALRQLSCFSKLGLSKADKASIVKLNEGDALGKICITEPEGLAVATTPWLASMQAYRLPARAGAGGRSRLMPGPTGYEAVAATEDAADMHDNPLVVSTSKVKTL